jgi:hypothetical protein
MPLYFIEVLKVIKFKNMYLKKEKETGMASFLIFVAMGPVDESQYCNI